MMDRKIKWLMYTVLIGLIPILSRLLIWGISQNRTVDILNPADFLVFGLILHVSNINEIEHFNDREKWWKTLQNGISIAFITMYGVLFASYLIGQSNPGLIDRGIIQYIAITLSAISFLLSFSVYNRVSTLVEP